MRESIPVMSSKCCIINVIGFVKTDLMEIIVVSSYEPEYMYSGNLIIRTPVIRTLDYPDASQCFYRFNSSGATRVGVHNH